ncbi:MAG: hypothetical protein P0Y55_06420 [Candidatus Cohnella colombiensis]|uniref:Uncharacterized protein n=1 Tax=Candidatus Cohnella colombiensis TaxID=3121368 RepID=A0AA95F108_9BACL|nr:MAG: hypothetical protein P0Y55_06420 [Cohnella sp.]
MENEQLNAVVTEPETAPEPQPVMGKVVIGAAAAAVVGAVAWGLISFYSERELGILAWGIGALVGFAVAFMAKKDLIQNHLILSVVFGIGGVIAGKYIHYTMLINDLEKKLGISLAGETSFTDMFEGYDILWIALAAYTAWTIPKRMAGRM